MTKFKFLSILALLCITASSAWADVQPTGSVTTYKGCKNAIYVDGTASDADVPGQSISVDVYVKQSGSTIKTLRLTTIASTGRFAGFVSGLAAGNYDVTVYALNNSGSNNPDIGTQSDVMVISTNDTQPTGALNDCTGGNGSVHFRGWSFDYDDPAWSPRVYIYYRTHGSSGDYTELGYFDTTIERADVNEDYGLTGNHGFEGYLPVAAGTYDFRIYFQNNSGSNNSSVTQENITVSAPNSTYNVPAHSASEAYWATFYCIGGNYQAAEGTQVFTVKLEGTEIKMNEVSDRIAKSGQGVVLKKTTTGNFTMTLTETAPAGDFSSNNLDGTMTQINTTGANDYYVLGGKNGAGFYKLSNTSGTIGANKAYLTYSGGGGAGAREFFLFDEATGIEIPTVEDVNADAVVYDLQGRRVVNPTKGLYIVNGKKVFINK